MSRGFTLVEVLITVALSAVLMIAIVELYITYGRVITFQQSSIAVALGASTIMDAARAAGLQAKRVVASHTFSGVAYNSGATTAIFELPAVDASGAIMTGVYDYVAIHASSTSAYRLTDAAAGSSRLSGTKQLTSVLSGLRFTYDNASFPSVTNVIVDATTSATVRGEIAETHLREHIYLRNL